MPFLDRLDTQLNKIVINLDPDNLTLLKFQLSEIITRIYVYSHTDCKSDSTREGTVYGGPTTDHTNVPSAAKTLADHIFEADIVGLDIWLENVCVYLKDGSFSESKVDQVIEQIMLAMDWEPNNVKLEYHIVEPALCK